MTDGSGLPRRGRALLDAGARGVQAAARVRLGRIRRASRRSARLPQARRRGLPLGDGAARRRGRIATREGRVVSTLEGGYNTEAFGRCVVEHVRVLAA